MYSTRFATCSSFISSLNEENMLSKRNLNSDTFIQYVTPSLPVYRHKRMIKLVIEKFNDEILETID